MKLAIALFVLMTSSLLNAQVYQLAAVQNPIIGTRIAPTMGMLKAITIVEADTKCKLQPTLGCDALATFNVWGSFVVIMDNTAAEYFEIVYEYTNGADTIQEQVAVKADKGRTSTYIWREKIKILSVKPLATAGAPLDIKTATP